MPRTGINEALSTIISAPPDWANTLDADGDPAYFLPRHKAAIESFLSATTDSVRLVRASKASSHILAEFDMSELEQLRATVQASELLRVIPYSRQTDHSAHTLYLFLLGIYLFFACRPLRAGIATFLKETKDPGPLISRFLFQWAFVSLLHDIGYVFQGRSKNEIRAGDRYFRAATITSLMGNASTYLKRAVRKDFSKIEIKPFEPIENAEDMLSTLRHMPWGPRAGFADDAFETFYSAGPQDQQITSDDLEEYAYRVASTGYDGFSEGTVDHAIASGLFLIRYSSLWYWLAAENGFDGEVFAPYRENYKSRDIACACFATAAHNMIGAHAKPVKLEFEKNPIMYLGILCDELQKWDRFPAGERHLVDLSSFERHCTDSERITIEGGWDGESVIVNIEEKELAAAITKTLQKRLDAFERFIKINPPVTPPVPPVKNEVAETSSPAQTDDSKDQTVIH